MKIKQGLFGSLLLLMNMNKAKDNLNDFLLQKKTNSVSVLFIFSILKSDQSKDFNCKVLE